MSTLTGFVSIDNKGNATVALLSDSRLTFIERGKKDTNFDYSPKLFYLKSSPSIFGYCGDSIFVLGVLTQICTALDISKTFIESSSINKKTDVVLDALNESAKYYPGLSQNTTQIVQIINIGKKFFMCEYEYNGQKRKFNKMISNINIAKGADSVCIGSWGSGRTFYKKINSYMRDKNGKYSRVYFRSMVLLLKHEVDKMTGGAPQMVVLSSDGLAKPVGIQYKKQMYLLGLPHIFEKTLDIVEFRNEAYEFVNENGTMKSRSQKHGYKDWIPTPS